MAQKKLLKRAEFDQKKLKPGQNVPLCGAQEATQSWDTLSECPRMRTSQRESTYSALVHASEMLWLPQCTPKRMPIIFKQAKSSILHFF